MEESKHIAVDLGAESGRIIVSFISDDSFRMEEIHRFPTGGMTLCGNLHWNIYSFWEEILKGIRKCTEKWGAEFSSLGVDAWGVDFALLDSQGEPTGLPFHYRDERTAGTPEIIESEKGSRWLYKKTGIQLLIINTLNQLVAMKRDGSSALEYGRDILFIGDLFHYLFSGVSCTEYTAASISQLADTRTCDWSDEIFEVFGIPKRIKNRIVKAGEPIGPILPEIAEMTGLSEQCLVIPPAVHDTASAASAIPAEGDDWAYISTGTWIMAGFEIPETLIDENSYAMNISNSAGVFDTSLFLKNTMGLWIIQQCKEVWNRDFSKDLAYSNIVDEVERSASEGLFIDPDHPSFLNPNNMIAAIRLYLKNTGQPCPQTNEIGRIGRIVYESLAFKIRYVFELLSKTLNCTFSQIHAIGGGIQNEFLMKTIADSLGKNVIAGPVEAAAAGNSMMQAYGCGKFESHAEIRSYLRNVINVKTWRPDSDLEVVSEERYRSFIKVVGLKELE